MKHRLVVLLLLLVGGAIVNLAVAWGCALTLYPFKPFGDSIYPDGPDAYWILQKYERRGVSSVHSAREKETRINPEDVPDVSEFLPEWTNIAMPSPEYLAAERCREWSRERANGWPMLSLWCQIDRHVETSWDARLINESVKGGIALSFAAWQDPHNWDHQKALPLRLIWPGFAINTLFYAVMLSLLFAGPFVVRRWRRIRRGLCPRCAYDLRGSDSPSCPECGLERQAGQSRTEDDKV